MIATWVCKSTSAMVSVKRPDSIRAAAASTGWNVSSGTACTCAGTVARVSRPRTAGLLPRVSEMWPATSRPITAPTLRTRIRVVPC